MRDKVKFETLKCPDCGAKALSLNNTRVTGINCKQWNVVDTFLVDRKDIDQNLCQHSGSTYTEWIWIDGKEIWRCCYCEAKVEEFK